MLIHVTQADIDAGKQSDCYLCPIASAVNRALNNPQDYFGAQVYRMCITPKVGYKPQFTSRRVERFIFRFDHNLPVKPFNFRLAVEKRFE